MSLTRVSGSRSKVLWALFLEKNCFFSGPLANLEHHTSLCEDLQKKYSKNWKAYANLLTIAIYKKKEKYYLMATKTIRDSSFFFTSRLVKSVNISFKRALKFTILHYVSFPSHLYPEETADILRLHHWVPHEGNDVSETSTEFPYWWRVTTLMWFYWSKVLVDEEHYPY